MIARSVDKRSAGAVIGHFTESAANGWRTDREKLESLHAALKPFDQEAARRLVESLTADDESRRKQLATYEPLLRGGDPARGRDIFFGTLVACSACHRIGNNGGLVGPDLTKIGAIRSGRDLLESIVFPSSTFAQGYDNYIVTTKNREQYVGIIAERTEQSLVLRDSSGAEVRLAQDQVARMTRDSSSIMPEGLDRALTREEFADLLAFLQSLK
jgi:putative heme-binding domain-containing protein